MTDKAVGASLVGFSLLLFTYYSIWVIVLVGRISFSRIVTYTYLRFYKLRESITIVSKLVSHIIYVTNNLPYRMSRLTFKKSAKNVHKRTAEQSR